MSMRPMTHPRYRPEALSQDRAVSLSSGPSVGSEYPLLGLTRNGRLLLCARRKQRTRIRMSSRGYATCASFPSSRTANSGCSTLRASTSRRVLDTGGVKASRIPRGADDRERLSEFEGSFAACGWRPSMTRSTRAFPNLRHDRIALKVNEEDDNLRRTDFRAQAVTARLTRDAAAAMEWLLGRIANSFGSICAPLVIGNRPETDRLIAERAMS